MRNYSVKANNYRLPKERLKALQAFCLSARGDDLELVRDVAEATTHDTLADWIVLVVTSDRWGWARLEANHIPCSQQTFRIYRMKFFWLLDQYLRMQEKGHSKKTPRGR